MIPRKVPPLPSPLLAQMGIRDRAQMERIRFKTPLMFALGLTEPIKRSKLDTERAQQARAARVGRDVVRDDVVIEDAPDPAAPNSILRRARRADPLHTLLEHKSITRRQFDAVEALRADVESGLPSLAGASQSEVHTAPWARLAICDIQVDACASVRDAMAVVPPRHRMVLAWMLGGGTITGFLTFARVSRTTAVQGLRTALDAVAVHYLGER